MRRARRSFWTQAAAVAVLLTAVHTWPLVTSPGGLSLHHNGDVMLNEWIIAWVQHQLPRDPLHLFSANIFHPAPDALAFSEPLIVPALLGSPVRLLGGSPVLVHNLLLLTGLALTMLAGSALAWHWTGNRGAALLAGSAYAFNTQSLTRLEHLQAAHAYGLPLALLAADRLMLTGSPRYAAWLALWMVVMAYTSGYLVIFSTFALAVLIVVRIPEWRTRAAPVLSGFALAAAGAALAVIPAYLPYRRAATEQHMTRTLDSVAQFSATIDGYIASYSRLHHWLWQAGAPREFPDAYFPGIVVAILALMAVVVLVRRRADALTRGRVLAMAALCVLGCVLSLGTRTPVYGWLYDWVPPLSALRAAARFGVLFMFGAAMLAAFGLAALHPRLSRRRMATPVAAGLIILANIEAIRAPFDYTPFRGIPGVYSLLADEPGPVVLVEVPFYLPEAIFQNAEYVLNSTAHWRKLMNGYSGYTPATYREYVKTFWDFPAPHAVAAMRAAGATHLMVHTERYDVEADETIRRALENPALERLAVSRNNLVLFRIR